MGLAFLPKEEIVEQFNYLLINLSNYLSNHFRSFTNYYERFWLGVIGVEDFCIFGLDTRTNACIESYHCRLEARLSRHPQAWDFYCKY